MKKLSVFLPVLMAILLFMACGPAQQTNAPKASETEAYIKGEGTSMDVTGLTEAGSTGTTVPEITKEQITNDDGAKTTTAKPIEINAPVGSNSAQIVSFYNQYANPVKAAGKITVKKHNVREMTLDIPAVVRALIPSGAGGFDPNKNEMITETFIKGKGTKDTALKLNDFLPVTGKSYVSQLKASHVQSASCAKQGDGWVIKINLKKELLDMSAMQDAQTENMSEADRAKILEEWISKSGYASSMELGFGNTQSDENSQEPQQRSSNFDLSSATMEGMYQNGEITAVLNREGKLASLTLSYDMNMKMSFIGMEMKMDNTSKQKYQFTW